MSNEETISLNKFISSTGRCSRREADRLIDDGLISINGVVARKGNRVGPGDEVFLNGERIQEASKDTFVYLALNKPVGITCTTDQSIHGNIIDHVNYPERIFPIGRLDKPSEGLIFLTNDGDIVNKVLRAGNRHEKEYIVQVDREVTQQFINGMATGVPILDTVTEPCTVEKLSSHSFRIVLQQGLNRQIRRMCKHFDYKVYALKRVRIMHVHLGNLQPGQWRALTSEEQHELHTMLKDSSKTPDEQ